MANSGFLVQPSRGAPARFHVRHNAAFMDRFARAMGSCTAPVHANPTHRLDFAHAHGRDEFPFGAAQRVIAHARSAFSITQKVLPSGSARTT